MTQPQPSQQPFQVLDESNGVKIVVNDTPLGRASASFNLLGANDVELRVNLGGMMNLTRRASRKEVAAWLDECSRFIDSLKAKLNG